MIVAVTGMRREARIIGTAHGRTVVGGANAKGLRRKIDELLNENPAGIISIGIAGGLAPDLRPGSRIVANSIIDENGVTAVDEDWTERIGRALPGCIRGPIIGSDILLSSCAQKRALYEKTGALAVDMESHVAARAAAARNLPFAAVRVICDPRHRALPRAAAVALRPNGRVSVTRVLGSVLIAPWQIPALLGASHDSRLAFRALRRCRSLLGGGFAFPNLG